MEIFMKQKIISILLIISILITSSSITTITVYAEDNIKLDKVAMVSLGNFESNVKVTTTEIEAYSKIINEYIAACAENSEDWQNNLDNYLKKYPNVDPYVMRMYHTPCHYDELLGGDEPYEIVYMYYDIDKNGTQELILGIGHHELVPFAIFAFDGKKAVDLKLVNPEWYGSYSIYTNGVFGVHYGDADYYKLDKDGYTPIKVALSLDEMDKLLEYQLITDTTDWNIIANDVPVIEDTKVDINITNISFSTLIESLKTDMEGKTVSISGTLTLDESTAASKENLQSAIDSLVISSSDEEVAKSLACTSTPNADNSSATLEIWITLYNTGTTDISISNSDGSVSTCKVTVTEDTSEDDAQDDTDYTEEMHRLLFDEGTHDVLTYLRMDKNFTASQFIASNDDSYGMQIQFITDLMYRQWDGWKDLLTSETSVEEAKKILVSLLQSYEDKIKIASEAKTAIKVANTISDAFSNYLESSSLIKVMKSEELKTAKEYFSTDKVAKLLADGKFDELTIHINQILAPTLESPKAWNDLMSGFVQSAELSKAVKGGITKKVASLDLEIGGGLEDLEYGMKAITEAADVINYMYQLEALLASDEIYSEMLAYVRDNCVFPVVQQAAASLYSTINDGVVGIISDLTVKLVNKGAEEFVETALEAACEASTPLKIIKAGYDWGVDISNFLFKTGTAQELTDSLRSQVYLASCLGKWVTDNQLNYLTSVGTDKENEYAKMSYYSMYVLWESRKNAEETLQKLLDAYRFQKHSKNYTLSKDITNTLQSYEDHYFSKEKLGKLLGISVSCPVDLEVYNENGTKLLTIVDGIECQGYENNIYYYCSYNSFAEDYDKYIYYDENANYSVKLVGNDLGLVDCSISRIDSEGFTSERYFENMKIGNGTVIDLYNISENGADYKVINRDGSTVTNSMESRKVEYINTSAINLDNTSMTMKVGDRKLLTVSVVPANATNQKVSWESSDNKVVMVNSDGVITAVINGTATVTVSQGDLSQTCKVVVGTQNSGSTTPSSSGTGTIPTDGSTSNPFTGGNTGTPSGVDTVNTSTGGSTEVPSTNDSENGLIAKKVKLSKTSYVYNGKAKKPSVTVYDNNENKIPSACYKVSYSYNKKVGKATVTVKLKNGYFGTLKKNFTIKPKGIKLSSITGKSRSISVKWKKQKTQTTGYQLQYSTSNKFSKKATVTKTVKKNVTTKLTTKKLRAKKTYYVHIRTYKTVNKKKYYSTWSKVKKVKTKE